MLKDLLKKEEVKALDEKDTKDTKDTLIEDQSQDQDNIDSK
jgi:hypothetical protein